jgi:circadian clock protein KaiB
MGTDETKSAANSANGNQRDVVAAFEQAMTDPAQETYVLTLYVTGIRPRSQRAIDNIQRLCEEYLPGRYELKIVDIYQQPALAQGAQIIAAPTLVKRLPEPLRRIVGDMSDDDRVLVAMGIKVPEDRDGPATSAPKPAS